MRRTAAALGLLVSVIAPAVAFAGGVNRVYLVPALVECAGPASCVPRAFESAYTFDVIVAKTPGGKFTPTDKPSLTLELRGVKDPGGALFTGTLTLRVLAGRVSLPSLGTFPDDSPLTQTAPVAVTVKNGRGRLAYAPVTGTPNGLITNGGGIEVLDPTGKPLAVTGSQSKP